MKLNLHLLEFKERSERIKTFFPFYVCPVQPALTSGLIVKPKRKWMKTMFKLNGNLLEITLPQGKTNEELLILAKEEIESMKSAFFGIELQISGRITTHLAMFLGHELAHITKSVSLFDPKENRYFLVISH